MKKYKYAIYLNLFLLLGNVHLASNTLAEENTYQGAIFIEGGPHYYTDATGKKSENLYRGSENLAFLKANRLLIRKLEEKYIWANNGNIELIKTEKVLKDETGHERNYTVFTNPDGEGLIVIRHEDYKAFEEPIFAGDIPLSYKEYRLGNNGAMEQFEGQVSTWFYPPPPKPWLHNPPISISKKHSVQNRKISDFFSKLFGD